eukprot:scaffold175938_cov51-Attheya_sp.AAC.1
MQECAYGMKNNRLQLYGASIAPQSIISTMISRPTRTCGTSIERADDGISKGKYANLNGALVAHLINFACPGRNGAFLQRYGVKSYFKFLSPPLGMKAN